MYLNGFLNYEREMENFREVVRNLDEQIKGDVDMERDVELDETYLFKLRGYGLCVILNPKKQTFYNLKEIKKNSGGISWFDNYNDNKCKHFKDKDFDIIAYKKMYTQSNALSFLLSESTEVKWDWEENEEVDWNNVKQGTKILVKDFEESDGRNAEFIMFYDNRIIAKVTANNEIYGWRYGELVE